MHISGPSAVSRAWEQTLSHPVLRAECLSVVRSCLMPCLCPQVPGSCRQTDRQLSSTFLPALFHLLLARGSLAPQIASVRSPTAPLPSGFVGVVFPLVQSLPERRGMTRLSTPSPAPCPRGTQVSLIPAVSAAQSNRCVCGQSTGLPINSAVS